jgi:hypothetical protein
VISVPQTDDPVWNRNIDHLNTIYETTTLRLGGRFVKRPPFDQAERSRDGVHFTRAGYRDLAATVLAVLNT